MNYNVTKISEDRNLMIPGVLVLAFDANNQWMFMSGVNYDSSSVDNMNRTIDMPLDRQIHYAFGAQYTI